MLAKRLWLTVLLAIVVSGLGHIYSGFVKRGVIILVIGIVGWIFATLFVPIPFSWLGIVYWVWQIWDAYKHYKKLNVGRTQITQ